MIQLNANVKIAGDDPSISTATISAEPNNISSSILSVINRRVAVKNPFIWGASAFGDGATMESGLDYYMSHALTNQSGQFDEPITLTINCRTTSIQIVFDTNLGVYPTTIKIDGVDHANNSSVFTLYGLNQTYSYHIVKISGLNRAKRPLVISGIFVGLDIKLTYNNLSKIDIEHSDRQNTIEPSYGVISNGGQIDIIDSFGNFRQLAEANMFYNAKVTVNMFETSTRKSEVVGVYYVTKCDYDVEDKQCTLFLSDNLTKMQEIKIEGRDLEFYFSGQLLNASRVDDFLKKKTPADFGFEKRTPSILNHNILMPYIYVAEDNLWAQWDKLCELCLGHIYQDNEGKTVFTSELKE